MFGVAIGQRAHQDRVEHAKHRGVNTNPEGQRDHRDERERWTPAQPTAGIAYVLKEDLERRPPKAVAYLFFDVFQALKLDPGGAARFRQGHAPGDELIDDHFKARTKLFVQILFQTAAADEQFVQVAEAAEHLSEHVN